MDEIQYEIRNVYVPAGFHGAGELFLSMEKVVPIIYGAAGCASYIWSNICRSDCTGKYLSNTAIDDKLISMGKTFDKLKTCVDWVQSKYDPDLIPVISTHISEMIDDDLGQFEIFKNNEKVIYIKTDSLHYQADRCRENVLEQLVARFALEKEKIPKSVNILGPSFNTFNWQSDLYELTSLLEKLDISINVTFPMNATIDDLKKITQAELNLVMYSYAERSAHFLKEKFDMDYIDAYQVGFKNTVGLIRKLGEMFAIPVSSIIRHEMEKHYPPFDNLIKSPWHDHLVNELNKVALVGNTNQVLEIADFVANEIGMTPVIIATIDDINNDRFNEIIKYKGLTPEVVLTKARSHQIESLLKEYAPNVIFGSDYEEKIAEELGVSAFIPICHPTMVTYALAISPFWGFRGGCFLTQEILKGGIRLLKRIRSISVSSAGESKDIKNYTFTLHWGREARERFEQICGMIPKFLGSRDQIAQNLIRRCEKIAQKQGKVSLDAVEAVYSSFESHISK
jgi:light-independent protochlorophyllide reductase B subunit